MTNNLADSQPTVDVAVDRRVAAVVGLSDQQIGQAVATALRGAPVGSVTLDGIAQNVVLRTGSGPADLEALRALPLRATPLGEVRLGDVASVREVQQAASITRIDGTRSASITARPSADDLGTVTADLQQRLDALTLPPGATAEIGGVSAEQDEAFATALIGMLMLIGIVVTNAIVLIDLVNQYRSAGARVRDAVIDGARRRLRPILMTAVATICALFPMSLGLSGGGVFISQPLAVVVIGGLISSTLLTLVLVPVLYSLVERARERMGRRRSGSPARTGKPEPAAAPPRRPGSARASGGVSVRGLVTTGKRTPLPGAVLTLVDVDGRQVGQTTSAGDGSYEILALRVAATCSSAGLQR